MKPKSDTIIRGADGPVGQGGDTAGGENTGGKNSNKEVTTTTWTRRPTAGSHLCTQSIRELGGGGAQVATTHGVRRPAAAADSNARIP